MSTPLSEMQTFKDVVDELDAEIRDQLSATNNTARATLELQYTFNNDGTITIAINTTYKVINTTRQVLGTITTSS